MAGAVTYAGEQAIGTGDRGGGAIAFADKKGDVREDKRGMAEARALGKAIVNTILRYKRE